MCLFTVRKKHFECLHVIYHNPPPKLMPQILLLSPYFQWCNQTSGRLIKCIQKHRFRDWQSLDKPRINLTTKGMFFYYFQRGCKDHLYYETSTQSFLLEVGETIEPRYWACFIYLYTLMKYHGVVSVFIWLRIKPSWKLHSDNLKK